MSPTLSAPDLFTEFGYNTHLHSFPTRRSSDLCSNPIAMLSGKPASRSTISTSGPVLASCYPGSRRSGNTVDRKSTRLNSSHRCISYAVFCLKKKKHLHGSCEVLSPEPAGLAAL